VAVKGPWLSEGILLFSFFSPLTVLPSQPRDGGDSSDRGRFPESAVRGFPISFVPPPPSSSLREPSLIPRHGRNTRRLRGT